MSKRKKKNRTTDSAATPPDYGDWRILAGATLAEPIPAAYPGGPSHEPGAHVIYSTSATGPVGEEIFFSAPSAVALCMSLAIRGMRDVQRLKRVLVYQNAPSPRGLMKAVADPNIPMLFDMFEASIVTATFCYAALEAFANYFLASRLTGTITLSRGEGLIALPADEVPRRASLEEKLAGILPGVLGVTSPKGLAVWEKFKRIKTVRDAAVQLKAGDVHYAGPMMEVVDRPLLSAFFQDDIIDFPKYTIEMIEHFGPPREGSQWLAHARRKLSADSH